MSDIAEVHPLVQSYLDGMARATAERQPGESFLVMFLGSTIGNFERKCAWNFCAICAARCFPATCC